MTSLGRWLMLGCLPVATLPLPAAVGEAALRQLVDDSPFQPRGAPAVGADAPDALEFRGYFFDGGEQLFSIRDVANRRSLWLRLNEPVDGFVARQFNPGTEALRLEYAGRTLTLPLSASKVVEGRAIPIAAAPVPAAAASAPAETAASPEVRAAEEKLAETRQLQAYEERRRLVLERRKQLRPVAAGTK